MIVAWVAIKLFIEFGNERGWIVLHVPTVLSVGIVFAILAMAAAYKRGRCTREGSQEHAELAPDV